MMRKNSVSLLIAFGAPILAAVVLLAGSCETIRDAVDAVRKPEVRIAGTELEALTFTGVTLLFEVEVQNPNPIGIGLSGFDYELEIEGNSFVSGQIQDRVTIAARDSSIIPLPVELGFAEVVQTFEALEEREEAAYRLSSGFIFNLPVLGRVRIPVQTEGTFPILRPPRLQVLGLRLNQISLAGASLELELEMTNRNNFRVFVESLEYRFQVDGRNWASGMRQERVRIPDGGSAGITVPIDLDFGALGRGVYQLILGGERMPYALEATVHVGTSLRALEKATLPFRLSGEVGIRR
jgi:LEA14-like dessication related protein